MALHERVDQDGNRRWLTDQEVETEKQQNALVILGLVGLLLFVAPGMLIERYVCPTLDGWSWFIVAATISALIAIPLWRFMKIKGIVAFLLLGMGSVYVLWTTDHPLVKKQQEME